MIFYIPIIITIIFFSVQVLNMEGSIFKWANEDKALVDHKNEPTKFVHPFSYKYALPTLSRSKWKWSTAEK